MQRPSWLDKKIVKTLCAYVGLLLFVVGSWLSIRQVMALGVSFRPGPVVFSMLVLAPLTLHLSIRRFQWLTVMADIPVGYREGARVVVLGGLANILPLPGALMVRFTYLADKTSIKTSTQLNIMAVLVWIAGAGLLAALFLARQGYESAAALFFVVVGLLFVAAALQGQRIPVTGAALCRLAVLQLVMTASNILRFVVISHAFDMPLPGLVASLMAVTGIVSTLTGVFPAGLGLTELLAASVTSLMALPASLGFLVSSVNRLTRWVALTLFMPVAVYGARSGAKRQ